jgi:hypothetical protein
MTELTTTGPAEQFRAKAATIMIDAANMTLHQLVDEFQRLADIIDKNTIEGSQARYPTVNEVGQLAVREQRMINAASRARFGISFDTYDRSAVSSNDW